MEGLTKTSACTPSAVAFSLKDFFASAGTLESMNPSLAGLAYFEMIAYSDEFT